jgi:hypothetical protein
MVDITDKTKPFIVSRWKTPTSYSAVNIGFYHNESLVLVAIRYYGFAILEITPDRKQLI